MYEPSILRLEVQLLQVINDKLGKGRFFNSDTATISIDKPVQDCTILIN